MPTAKKSSTKPKITIWLNLGLTLLLIGGGLWYLIQEITLAEMGQAFAQARLSYIFLALLIILLTAVAKTWRWQLLFYPQTAAPHFAPLFWALAVGQFVNVIVPFLRLGEIARIYALDQQHPTNKMRALGTLVVEKTLDLIMLLLTVVVLLPIVLVSEFIQVNSLMLITAPLILCLILYFLAYQTPLTIRILHAIAHRLPAKLGRPFIHMTISGLEGLAALRDRRTLLWLIASSVGITFLAILTPWLLFPAFNLPFGIVQATLLNAGATIANVPATTPAKIGVIEFVVIFILTQFDPSQEAAIWSYALVYHLIVILPQIGLGIVAAPRTNWQWSQTQLPMSAPSP